MLLIGSVLASAAWFECLFYCESLRLNSDFDQNISKQTDKSGCYKSVTQMSRQDNWREPKRNKNSGVGRHRCGGERGGRGNRGRSLNDDRPKPPPGLRGRSLGLWYRNRQKLKKEGGETANLKAQPFPLNLDPEVEAEIQTALEHVKARPPEHLMKKYKSSSQEASSTSLKEDKNIMEGICNADNTISYKYSHLEESLFKTSFIKRITGSIEENLKNSLSVSLALAQDPDLDEKFYQELQKKASSAHYQKMLEFRKRLPSFKLKEKIISLVESNQVIVISGETGCGKTTQVAQFILDREIMKGAGSKCHILCTQPRRISAISVAERVADERDESIGSCGSVGYQIRLEKKLPRYRGSILFCTTGILLQFMQTNPALTNVSHIIIDEIHERDTLSDFSITILKDVLAKRRDLKLILMSATLNAERFSKYYNNCPMLTIPGFTYPVKEFYLEDVLEIIHYQLPSKRSSYRTNHENVRAYVDFIEPYVRNLKASHSYSRSTLNTLLEPEIEEAYVDLSFELIKYICFKNKSGAILVFLPGWDKISALNRLLTECGSFPSSRYWIIPLHSMMPTSMQKTIFNTPPPGVRKIVIATNIAETSITIDDIVYVIDCGKIKMKNFDVINNLSTLKPEWVSLANARQRRGRAGRVQPGICYHLFSKAREMTLADYPKPEMLRTRLEEVVLQAKILQLGYVKPFLQKVLDPPDPVAIDLALKMLHMLNALDKDETLTPLGYHLAQLPLDPQTGKMILMGALFKCIDPIFSIAASLSFKDAFIIPLGREKEVDEKKEHFDMGRKSDHLVTAEAFSQWELAEYEGWGNSFCQRNFLSRNILYLLRDMKKQFAEYLYDMNFLSLKDHKAAESNINSENVGLIRAIICSGLYPNVAVVKKVKVIRKLGKVLVSLMTTEDGKVEIHPKSVNEKALEFESRFLLYHLKMKSTKIYLFDTSMVHPLPLLFFGHNLDTYNEKGKTVIELSNLIRFIMSPSTARLITELRIRLDWLIEEKISNPGVTNWSNDTEEGCILRAITKLITAEDQSLMEEDDESQSSSD
ncbi:ATP-dependent DNA/RNA helicase DHX36-like [Lycorma delicatula]|uniref:ATP-dependent DNA/RNA helicase DHX36-like n=1 Tax=Lycorma delicatula TaxID=130591 RepID=UPI003F5103AD